MDMHTIERDLGERLLGIAERDAEGYWQLTHAARITIPVKHLHGYARLSGTEHLFPNGSLRYLLEQLSAPELSRVTHVQATPHEDLNGAHTFTALQAAIVNRHPCRFIYTRAGHAMRTLQADTQERHLVSGRGRRQAAQEFQRCADE